MEKPRPSTVAWASIGAGILAYDMMCKKGETLSERVDDWLIKYPRTTYAAVGAVALHLLNLLPNNADPIHHIIKLKKVDDGL